MDCHNSSDTIDTARSQQINAYNRLDLAVGALDAVRDLCCEASNAQKHNTLSHVDADNFACLLGIILGEIHDARKYL